MIRDRVDIDALRDGLSDLHYEITEVIKLCDMVDFAENPSVLESEYIDMSDMFPDVDIPPEMEDELAQAFKNGAETVSLLADTLKRSVENG